MVYDSSSVVSCREMQPSVYSGFGSCGETLYLYAFVGYSASILQDARSSYQDIQIAAQAVVPEGGGGVWRGAGDCQIYGELQDCCLWQRQTVLLVHTLKT
jgi:hypothetical protein